MLSPYLDILKYDLRIRFLALSGKINQFFSRRGDFFAFTNILVRVQISSLDSDVFR